MDDLHRDVILGLIMIYENTVVRYTRTVLCGAIITRNRRDRPASAIDLNQGRA